MAKQEQISARWLIPALLMTTPLAHAAIPGIGRGDCTAAPSAIAFNLRAQSGHIALGDGNSMLTWGYADGDAVEPIMQYPGPTLLVCEGDTVTVNLANDLPVPVSIVFPGQEGVVASGGSVGLLTNEAADGTEVASYTFTASSSGTYLYQSGSYPELEIEMGLVGALIVRPAGFVMGTADDHPNRFAYGTPADADTPLAPNFYDREYLFFLTDMDRRAHEQYIEPALAALAGSTATPAEKAALLVTAADPANYASTLWFINGRNGPDTMHPHGVGWLPSQPYGALAQMHPGERVLMRLVGAGRDLHPFHHHGNNAWVIAQDGQVLESSPGAASIYPDFQSPRPSGSPYLSAAIPALAPIADLAGLDATIPDQSISNFTIQTVPGNTYDAIFTWTGMGLNWDIYGDRAGHSSGDCGALIPHEDPNSHCKDLEGSSGKVTLPEQQALTFGGLWTGSPYLGSLIALPPLQGGLNPGGGFSYMWHSHTERELTNDDIFPGGMMTMMIVEAAEDPLDPDHPGACIPETPDECAP